MTARSVPEWIGGTPDAKVPPRVRLRIFERHDGRCHRTGLKLRPGHWQLDHVIALANGGEHRESNLAPISTEAHREKTREDVKVKAKIQRVKAKHAGAWPKGRGFGPVCRKLDGSTGLTKRAQRERAAKEGQPQ